MSPDPLSYPTHARTQVSMQREPTLTRTARRGIDPLIANISDAGDLIFIEHTNTTYLKKLRGCY